MKMYEFSVIASGLDPTAPDFEARLYEAGCDDATISFQKGHTIIDFAREAESAKDAVCSAVEAVVSVGAKVERIEPDPLVSLADIAARTGMSRAVMTQYAKGQRGKGFPAPAWRVKSESPLWDWATVASWLSEKHKISQEVVAQAKVVSAVNEILQAHEGKSVVERIKEHVCA